MDAAVVGVMAAVTVASGTLYWYLLVHPDLFLAMLDRRGRAEQSWFAGDDRAMRVLRWGGGALVFVACFLTGLVTAFLTLTR